LKSVLYHNAMDVVSLAVLLDHMAALLADPLEIGGGYGVDLIALAKLFEDMQELDTATRLYLHGLEHEDAQSGELPKTLLLGAIMRLARLYKRQEDYPAAIELWEEAAEHGHLEAHIELAKYYEHRLKDYPQAIHWTEAALSLAGPLDHRESDGEPNETGGFTPYEGRERRDELEHRLNRLVAKTDKT
jgi:tetratricopeptide (TPR) repeat protein